MKKLNNWKLATLGILACVAEGIATFLIAQDEHAIEETDCKWHVQNQKPLDDGTWSAVANSLVVSALVWNDCTGELVYVRRTRDSDIEANYVDF